MLKAKGAVYLRHGGTAGRLLGDADPGGSRRHSPSPSAGRDARRPMTRRRGRGRRRRRRDGAREGHRPLQRRRHLRRQGHRVSVLEAGTARPRLPLRVFVDRSARVRCGRPARTGGASRPSAVRRRVVRLQRHRRAAVVPAEAAEAGARSPSAIRRAPSARTTSRTRWWRCRTRPRASSATRRRRTPEARKPFVEVSGRKGLGREGRRPARHADREGRRRSRASATPSSPPPTRQRVAAPARGRRGALLHDQVLARQGDRVRPRRGAQLRGRERARTSSTPWCAPTTSCRKLAAALTAWTKPRLVASLGSVPPAELDGGNGIARSVGAGARGRAPRRRGRAGRAHARVLGAGQVRLLPGAGLQRLLPPRADPERRSGTTCAAGAPRRWSTSAPSSRGRST